MLLALAAVAPCRAQAEDDKTLSPYFVVQGDPAVDRLPLKDTSVEINVSGVIADVRVLQTYRNEGARPIHASYVFPASTRAAVYAMRMRIGDQVIVAKIKEREAAKQEFEAAKKEGKSASLLEQNRPNVFS
ncbi:MAG TPA: VIT domain-containing protein, partial [Pyrinomonadaceae bacterium]